MVVAGGFLVRYHLDGHDVKVVDQPDFLNTVKPVLERIKARETALAQAIAEREDE